MTLRKITSLTSLVSFVLTLVTSVVLFIVPEGRVAYWADWHLWGLTKEQWGDVHLTLGTLFILAIALHVYYNWKAILSYLKNRAKEIRIFTPSFLVALVICLATTVGTLAKTAPFTWFLDLNAHFKDVGAATYGEPPYGHAELSSLQTLAKRMGLDQDKALEALRSAQVDFRGPDEPLKDVALRHNVPPQRIYDIMAAAAAPVPVSGAMPEAPPPGTGRRTLADLCQDFGLNMKLVERGLRDKGLKAEARATIKDLAEANSMAPEDLYALIRELAAAP